jgi:hypothetical protein
VHHAVLSAAEPSCVLALPLQAKLEEKERKHFQKVKGISFEGAHIAAAAAAAATGHSSHSLQNRVMSW